MGRLLVIAVGPDDTPDPENGFAVILGDCILPGHILARYPDRETVNLGCHEFATHYGLDARPLPDWDAPEWRRARFAVLEGGRRS